jgi:hypothetical protein
MTFTVALRVTSSGEECTYTFTSEEVAELHRLRLMHRRAERRERARAITKTNYAALGTDHPALVARDITDDMAKAVLARAGDIERMAAWLMQRGKGAEAVAESEAALVEFHRAKALAHAFIAAMRHAMSVLRLHRTHLAHLVARIEEFASCFVQVIAPKPMLHLAIHHSANAPPAGQCNASHSVAKRSALTHEKR